MNTVLSTKKLTESQKALLLNAGISLVEYDAISVTLSGISVEKDVENAIIPSQNAVISLINNKINIKNCFCVGEKTKAMLEQNGFKVIENADYGKDLAEKIVARHSKKEFTFFCGNKRLDNIQNVLKQNDIDFQEMEIYKTHPNPKKFNRTFDGILFFSPSGVESFVSKNEIEEAVAFCIGTTTAAEAAKHTDKIVIATKPTVEDVIVQVAQGLGFR